MSTKPPTELESLISNVRVKLLDPLGRAIDGLRYQVRQGARIVAAGVTDGDGKVRQFTTEIGKPVTIHVAHFVHQGMKQISEFKPWNSNFSVKLVSGKVKHKVPLKLHQGDPGGYKRKTYVVKKGDTLSEIAFSHNVSTHALARANQLRINGVIQPGQILQMPHAKSGGSASASDAPTQKKPPSSPAPSRTSPSTPSMSGQGEPSPENGPPATPVQTEVPPRVAVPKGPPPVVSIKEDRGASGAPKSQVSLVCQEACIKLGDQGPLIEELNIRLNGFGGTVSAPEPLNKFTAKTEAAVKQFQRDYMLAPETGKVCGPLLRALDEFGRKYPVSLSKMKCTCGHCKGFGNGFTNAKSVGMASKLGTEYPGIHRALLWGFKAALFYVSVKDKSLGYKFLRVSSGYRCWYNNKAHGRKTTNHMGNALDLQFAKGASTTRCEGAAVDEIRAKIFVKRLGAQLGWPAQNKLSLERASDGATSWVHVDVRQYEAQYKDSHHYAVTQAAADGDSLVTIAQRESRLSLIACGGLAQSKAVSASRAVASQSADDLQRLDIEVLKLSAKGAAFVQGWESCHLSAYDDSEGFCTIGWGHLIAREKCANIRNKAEFQAFKAGLSQSAADKLFLEDAQTREEVVKKYVQVPLFQHEYDALVSLIFNMGSFKKCPKLLSKLNMKDYQGCCDEFADITNGGTSGLVLRRKAEMKMFRNNLYDSSH
jgi:GH24 family phage-related lysozyme (muramidase)/LysM repeat protein